MTETTEYKKALEKELSLLESELKTVGRKNPDNPKDWQPTPTDLNTLQSDENEVADSIETFEENTAILKDLEIRYNEVKSALQRIAQGTFGKCSVCKLPIEAKKLEANPAATTCIKHVNS
ncbi:MAG: TraR/DksA C4-type zinc finger protein [Candidatus Pacebacteria bacterium]|nr:TraR/DksA C4-type zinc finger protein [Candidatus Paceibacterota bacterium]